MTLVNLQVPEEHYEAMVRYLAALLEHAVTPVRRAPTTTRPRSTTPCACGCGQFPSAGKQYLLGHYIRTQTMRARSRDRLLRLHHARDEK